MTDEAFRAFLKRCSDEVKTWPEWKRNLLGPHYSDKIAAEKAAEAAKKADAGAAS